MGQIGRSPPDFRKLGSFPAGSIHRLGRPFSLSRQYRSDKTGSIVSRDMKTILHLQSRRRRDDHSHCPQRSRSEFRPLQRLLQAPLPRSRRSRPLSNRALFSPGVIGSRRIRSLPVFGTTKTHTVDRGKVRLFPSLRVDDDGDHVVQVLLEDLLQEHGEMACLVLVYRTNEYTVRLQQTLGEAEPLLHHR